MKRFLVFASDYYYPGGGWDDFQNDFDTAADAFKAAKGLESETTWTQVVDTETKQEIEAAGNEAQSTAMETKR